MTEDEERQADEVNIAFQMGAEWQMKRSKARIEQLEAALGYAETWIDKWSRHVGSCHAPADICTCGREAILHETRAALEGKKDE